jgi:hypothetical protein
MKNIEIKKIINDVENRSAGKLQKKMTLWLWLISGLIFLICGVVLFYKKINPWLVWMFLTEGIGQLILAIENKKTYNANDYKIRYFNENYWGKLAYICFGITTITKFLYASLLAPQYKILLLSLSCFVSLINLAGVIYIKKNLNMFGGGGILFSSLICSLAVGMFSHNMAANLFSWNQLTYSFLLVLGVSFLRPWKAELANIFVWLWLFGMSVF